MKGSGSTGENISREKIKTHTRNQHERGALEIVSHLPQFSCGCFEKKYICEVDHRTLDFATQFLTMYVNKTSCLMCAPSRAEKAILFCVWVILVQQLRYCMRENVFSPNLKFRNDDFHEFSSSALTQVELAEDSLTSIIENYRVQLKSENLSHK